MHNIIKWLKAKREERRKIKYYRAIAKMFEAATQERLAALEVIMRRTDLVKYIYDLCPFGLNNVARRNIAKGNRLGGGVGA